MEVQNKLESPRQTYPASSNRSLGANTLAYMAHSLVKKRLITLVPGILLAIAFPNDAFAEKSNNFEKRNITK
jgi:hypothetical protein